jgi:hypothetical protein
MDFGTQMHSNCLLIYNCGIYHFEENTKSQNNIHGSLKTQ